MSHQPFPKSVNLGGPQKYHPIKMCRILNFQAGVKTETSNYVSCKFCGGNVLFGFAAAATHVGTYDPVAFQAYFHSI